MNCFDAEVMLSCGDASAELDAHVAGCAACQRAKAELSKVAALLLPQPLSLDERAGLKQVASNARAGLAQVQRRKATVRRFVGLAIAASLGAIVAVGLRAKPAPNSPSFEPRPIVSVGQVPDPEGLAVFSEANSFEEISFDEYPEVSWPTLSEGDVQ